MREESFNKPAEPDYTALHIVNGVLLLSIWVFTIGAYPGLPDQVPGHMGLHGVTRWDPKQSSPWFIMPILALVHGAIMYGISAMAKSTPNALNVPAKKELLQLPREGQLYAMAPMRGFMYGMATWLFVLTLMVQYELYRVAHAGPGADLNSTRMLLFVAAMLAVVIIMAVRSSAAVRRRIGAWHVISRDSTVR
jgi:uncharacterized membrane protein